MNNDFQDELLELRVLEYKAQGNNKSIDTTWKVAPLSTRSLFRKSRLKAMNSCVVLIKK